MDTTTLKREVRRAAAGDERAAAVLFDHFHPRVFRYALARLRDRPAAEDVAAETFAKVLVELGRFKWRGAGFEAWLFRIASNLVVDHVRRTGREQASDDVAGRLDATEERTPELAALAAETSTELSAMLQELAPDQREVLLLRFAGGLEPAEVGTVMGRNANAVRQLQFRALANLRRRMQQGVST